MSNLDAIKREFNECVWYMEKHFGLKENEARTFNSIVDHQRAVACSRDLVL